jgi:GNAT superfamily N-acetyltransferase
MEARVRLASMDDLDALASLVVRANGTYREWAGPGWDPPTLAHERSRWRERFEDAAAWNAVGESTDKLLGCVSFTDARVRQGRGKRIPDLAHLSRMFVFPEHWGHGIGGLLLNRAVEEMRPRGYKQAQLFTPSANLRSRRFYERQGWHLGEETRRWQGLLLVQYRLSL